MSDFNPDGVGIANGNIFGFPGDEASANIVIIPIPWDATASYGKGTSDGPDAILEASTQLDFYHPELSDAFNTKVYLSPISAEWKKINSDLSMRSLEYIAFLEKGGDISKDRHFHDFVEDVKEAQEAIKINLKEKALALLDQNKIVGLLGGEHSTPLGLIQAFNEKYDHFGILQIDAHADLRVAYEGFEQSHASIMYNVLQTCENMKRLVQVGIRDIAQSEINIIENSENRIQTFFDWDIKREQFEGKTWAKQVEEIIQHLPNDVYISFDIDGLRPELCPNTGTPVSGGFYLEEINYLFFRLVDSGKNIIGFDLNEVSPGGNGDWDANVGARALWNLICATEKSRIAFKNKA